MKKNAKLASMANRKKSKTLTVWYRDDLEEKVQYLKMKPGGLTAFIENALDKLDIPEEELQAMRLLNSRC